MARLIDVDALKKELRMADRCEDCERNARDCRYVYGHTRMDICEMLDEAPTVSGWISVQDRLPEKTGDYLVFTRGGVIWPYFFTGGTWFNFDGYKTEDVTHWMPLPEPPKGGDVNESD